MGPESLEFIENNAKDLGEQSTDHVPHWLERIRTYLETSEPLELHFFPDDLYKDFLKLVGLEVFDGRQIMEIRYENPTSYMAEENKNPSYEGSWTAEQVAQSIADRYASLVEFVNNYKASFCMKIDDKTALIFGQECDEQPGICEDCLHDEEYMELNADYNCDHGVEDTYEYKRWILLIDVDDIEESW